MILPINNGSPAAQLATKPVSPEFYPVEVANRLFMLDTHTLDVCRITPDLLHAMTHAPMEVLGMRACPVFKRPHATAWPDCRFLVLNLTHTCNLRCVYCFVREQEARGDLVPGQTMAKDTALQAVDEFFPQGTTPRVGFFGGEPLLCWDTLQTVVEYAECIDPMSRFSCTTNAVAMNTDKAAFFAERRNRISFIVSLDGSEDRHNAMRPMVLEGNSYEATRRGLSLLVSAGHQPTLRSTFTSDGLDLVSELEHLNNICDQGLGRNVSIEPVSLTEGCAFGAQAITQTQMRELEPMFLAAADWFIHRARAGKRARFNHLTKMLERLILKMPHCSECGAGRGYLTVSPAGQVHACHREKSHIGNLTDSGVTWLEEEREVWRDNHLDVHADCPTCPMRFLCGGGCRLDGLEHTGDVRRPDRAGCEHVLLRIKMAVKVLDAIGPAAAAKAAGIVLPHRNKRKRA